MNVVSNNFRMKNNADVQKAIDKIVTEVCENLTPEPEQRSIFDQTLKLLANGSPVKPTDTAKHLKTSPDKVISALKKFGAEFDQDGNILGLGLTLVATPHIYEFDGRKMYTWCAADALLCPVILKQTVRIESPDPVTGKKIQVHVTPDRVETIEPKSAVVSFIKNMDVTNVRGTACNNINFFSSPETAALWIAEHPNMMFYPVNDVYQALKHSQLNTSRDVIVRSKQDERRMCC